MASHSLKQKKKKSLRTDTVQLRVISEVHDNMVIHIVEKIQWPGELLGPFELSNYSSKDQQH